MNRVVGLFVLLVGSATALFSQNLSGVVYNQKTGAPLPFANVGIVGKPLGTISNSDGCFSINLAQSSSNDTLACTYIGYETQKFALASLDSVLTIQLVPEIKQLNEITVFANTLSPKEIIARMLKNKDANYQRSTITERVFRRDQNLVRKKQFNVTLVESSLPIFDDSTMLAINHSFPDTIMDYNDWLFDAYYNQDSMRIKVIKGVQYQDSSSNPFDKMNEKMNRIEKLITSRTSKKNYWKIKSGLLVSASIDNDSTESKKKSKTRVDSVDRRGVLAGRNMESDIHNRIWMKDFIQKTRKYKYQLEGGITIDGQLAYIIHFEPDGGNFEGRMYIGVDDYALIRLDYEKPKEIKGRGFSLFGVGQRVLDVSGSIYFQKYEDHYYPKYFMSYSNTNYHVNRPMSLVSKSKRFLFDKTIDHADFEVTINADVATTTEYLVTNIYPLSLQNYKAIKTDVPAKCEEVKQYNNPAIWKGYSIIEPTNAMKTYRDADND